MSGCQVCQLRSDLREQAERLAKTHSIEEVGASLRLDFDQLRVHIDQHLQKESGSSTERTIATMRETLDDLRDMVEVSKALAEKTEATAETITAYTNTVKAYHQLARELMDRETMLAEQHRQTEDMASKVLTVVINPTLMAASKAIITETAKLRDELKKAGLDTGTVNGILESYTRSVGQQVQQSIAPYQDALKEVLAVQPKGTKKKR